MGREDGVEVEEADEEWRCRQRVEKRDGQGC